MTNHINPIFLWKAKWRWLPEVLKGLGLAMAGALGEAGAKVAINYYNDEEKALAARERLDQMGCQTKLFKADVTDEKEVNQMVHAIEQSMGPVDVAVINATCDQPHHPIEEYSWEFYQSMLDFFIKSPFLITRAILPAMKRSGWGESSISARRFFILECLSSVLTSPPREGKTVGLGAWLVENWPHLGSR